MSVWHILFRLNISTALKGAHFYISICISGRKSSHLDEVLRFFTNSGLALAGSSLANHEFQASQDQLLNRRK